MPLTARQQAAKHVRQISAASMKPRNKPTLVFCLLPKVGSAHVMASGVRRTIARVTIATSWSMNIRHCKPQFRKRSFLIQALTIDNIAMMDQMRYTIKLKMMQPVQC